MEFGSDYNEFFLKIKNMIEFFIASYLLIPLLKKKKKKKNQNKNRTNRKKQ